MQFSKDEDWLAVPVRLVLSSLIKENVETLNVDVVHSYFEVFYLHIDFR